MSGQCGLCLSCGAPFIPIADDMVEYDKLGNISVLYLQKLVRQNGAMQANIKTPSFCAKPDSSHILHKTHHKYAVKIMTEILVDLAPAVLDFPFIRAPTGKRPVRLLAQWHPPGDEIRLDLSPLADLIAGLEGDGGQTDDYTHEVLCCSNCNHTMTMNFWFRYHLYAGSDSNEDCLIPDDTINVFKAFTHGHPDLDEALDYWTVGAAEDSYPTHRYKASKDIMSAAVGYYLHMCVPVDDHDLNTPEHAENKKLYLHMCWVVLEVTCLLCEYWRGSLDMENHDARRQKRYQCHKSPLGAVELYFSYFCWRLLGFSHASVAIMSFENFHQLYMWSAADCEELFPRDESDASGHLLADMIRPNGMDAPSRPLIQAVAAKMAGVFERGIARLGRHLAGPADPELTRYFLPRKYIPRLTLLARGCGPPCCLFF